MRIQKLWIILAVVLTGLIALSLRLNYKHHTLARNGNSMEIWSHRGVHHQFPENSKPAVDEAARTGFTGVEIDVFYDDDAGLVVSHDYPYIPVDGKLVTLEDVIYGYGDNFKFWLDLKNLRRHNVKNVKRILNHTFAGEAGLKDRVYIESGNGRALRRLNSDFNCIYWVQFSRKGSTGWLKRSYIKLLMSITNFEGITTDHRYIDDAFVRHFKGKCWYVFTVNSADRLEVLRSLPEVEVVLTDLSKKELQDQDKGADI